MLMAPVFSLLFIYSHHNFKVSDVKKKEKKKKNNQQGQRSENNRNPSNREISREKHFHNMDSSDLSLLNLTRKFVGLPKILAKVSLL